MTHHLTDRVLYAYQLSTKLTNVSLVRCTVNGMHAETLTLYETGEMRAEGCFLSLLNNLHMS